MIETESIGILRARWPAPSTIRALTTLRRGGVSQGPYWSLNLGGNIGDRAPQVAENRRRVRRALQLPNEPVWLQQVHGSRCLDLDRAPSGRCADGAHTVTPGQVCAVLTADCLPLFVCDPDATRVGLFHVGWKGLAGGIVERALSRFVDSSSVHCWLGPCISAAAFEVGGEVREALAMSGNDGCFTPSRNTGHWMADLYGLVAHRLRRASVDSIAWDSTACTHSDPGRFFSYRRLGRCGRMASLIWIDAQP